MDAGEKVALQALVRLSVDTELQFIRHTKAPGPLMQLAVLSRMDAVNAMYGLAQVDADNPGAVRVLQARVQQFLDLIGRIKDIIAAGEQAEQELMPEEMEEVRNAILGDTSGDAE